MPQSTEDNVGSLERAREALYSQNAAPHNRAPSRSAAEARAVPHSWGVEPLRRGSARHVRLASMFLGAAVVFFVGALGVAGYFFYFGSNAVSTNKIEITLQGPTTIAGGDTVPLSLTITNKNPTELENATIEIDFPEGTRSADNQATYPRYVENVGTLASGATITRSIKVIMFGAAGQSLTLPVSFSYGTASSNAVFEKKTSHDINISSTPLSVSVEALTETVSGAPLTFTMIVRSNATMPLDNVVLAASVPIGFAVTASSQPLAGSTFSLGTLAPGASKRVSLTGTLTGLDAEQRVFHFTVGTAKSAGDQALAVSYMTQDATVSIAAPFIATALMINGNTAGTQTIAPGGSQSVSLSYTNTLSTPVADAIVSVAISGSAVDYGSIRAANGFYNSANHTIVFSKDTDPALAQMAPGASGIGAFTFSTLPAGGSSPAVTFSLSASGTRVGQANVPERVTAAEVVTAKVATVTTFNARSSYRSGPFPPVAEKTTTYAVIWNVQNKGSAIAGGTVTATLPTYVSYVGVPTGSGTFSYNSASRTLTWSTGDIAQGGRAEGGFQVALTPSTTQRGGIVPLTSTANFSGHDRFAGVAVSATAAPATTETSQDAGYVPADAVVQ